MKTKTVLPVLIVVLIATTLALFTSGCGEKLTVEKEITEEKGLTVEEIAENIQQKEGNIKDYSCIIHLNLFFEGEALEREFEVMCKKPDMYRILTKKPGKETEKVEISDGEYMWTYYPWKNTTIKVKLPETSGPEEKESEEKESAEKESGENSGTGFIEDLLNDSSVSLLGTEEIDGRPAYLLGKNSEEKGDEGEEEGAQPGYREKFWIDKETGTLLRYETYDDSENLTLKFEIRDMKINMGIQDSEFEFEAPEGTKVENRDFGKSYPPENLTGPDGDGQIALGFIIGFCP
ncbi:MAG: outer membrane lipoprotein carrier protein LolA [Methanosarcina sp.]|nr:MAG: outer membrane lipoprotein carrier protein LolA [Methanosarcina sp.]